MTTDINALAGIGVVAIFLGLWLIWPAIAIIAVGAVCVAVAVGLILSRRQRGDQG